MLKEGKFKRVVAYLEKAYEQGDAAGELTLLEAAATGTLYRVKALLESGADREQSDELGQTPLMLAVAAGHVEVVKMLCAAGANVYATRNDGGDLWTCAFAKPKVEIIGTLIEHGLSPNQPRKTAPALLLAFGVGKPKEITGSSCSTTALTCKPRCGRRWWRRRRGGIRNQRNF